MVKLREDLIKAEQIKLQEIINEINNSTITKASNEVAQEISEPIFKIIKTADTFKQLSDQEEKVKKSNVGAIKKEAKVVKKSKVGRPIKKEAKVKKSKVGRPAERLFQAVTNK